MTTDIRLVNTHACFAGNGDASFLGEFSGRIELDPALSPVDLYQGVDVTAMVAQMSAAGVILDLGDDDEPLLDILMAAGYNLSDVGAFSTLAAGLSDQVVEFQQQVQNSITSLPPCANGGLTFFNEQQFSWGFQVQNSSSTPMKWQVVISDANYQLDDSQISNNTDFRYQEVDNADGTFDHIFTSQGELPAFSASQVYSINGVNFGFTPTSAQQSVNCEHVKN